MWKTEWRHTTLPIQQYDESGSHGPIPSPQGGVRPELLASICGSPGGPTPLRIWVESAAGQTPSYILRPLRFSGLRQPHRHRRSPSNAVITHKDKDSSVVANKPGGHKPISDSKGNKNRKN